MEPKMGVKVKVDDFLWKFIKLGSTWSGQLPDLASTLSSDSQSVSNKRMIPGIAEHRHQYVGACALTQATRETARAAARSFLQGHAH
jgi:hypothetical protein